MIVSKTIEIDMGHRVPNHKSKCSNLHGHRYKIEVGVDDKVIDTKGISDEGMVIDFSDLKQIMIEEIDQKLDHGFMIYRHDKFYDIFYKLKRNHNQKIIIVDFIPTAENIAKRIYEVMKKKLLEKDIQIKYVVIYETPTSMARYEEENK